MIMSATLPITRLIAPVVISPGVRLASSGILAMSIRRARARVIGDALRLRPKNLPAVGSNFSNQDAT
jgi:hypothetical protein